MIDEIKRMKKGDLHIHAGRGCSVDLLNEITKKAFPKCETHFSGLSEMDEWISEYIENELKGFVGYLTLLKATFIQLDRDNIITCSLSFDFDEVIKFENPLIFFKVVDRFNKKYAHHCKVFPELTLCRPVYDLKILDILQEIFEYGWFYSIDICGNELSQPYYLFKEIYRLAKQYNLILAAHVGEFSNSETVVNAIKELNLQRIYHGISVVNSPYGLDLVADKKIEMCICPASNMRFKIYDKYENCPIEKLYNRGIPVALGTDDMIVTNMTMSMELFELYKINSSKKEMLEGISLNGLTNFGKRIIL